MRMCLAPLVLALAGLLTSCGVGGPTPEEYATANELLRAVNAARANGATCGYDVQPAVPRLALDGRLLQAAVDHSDDMLSMGALSHSGSDGSNPGQRIARAGYEAATWGENAAAGFGSPNSVVDGWMTSAGHCRNIMNSAFTEMGGARAGSYWTLVLARPH